MLTLVVATTACSSNQVAETITPDVTPTVSPTAASTVTTAPAIDQPSTSSVAAADEPTPSIEPTEPTEPTVATTNESTDRCRTIADLDDEAELLRWQIVNDGVMGGRSSAEAMVADSVVAFAGEIVTDGGGFSSIRLALDEPLGEVSRLSLRVRTDGRSYELTVADAAPGRDRRVSHQAVIPATGTGAWEEVVVEFEDLEASIFGRPVTVDPFEPTAAIEIGIILADGTDGPFRLELDWISACT